MRLSDACVVERAQASMNPRLYFLPMRRSFFIVFVALLLPFQIAWSAASAYCQHEGAGQQSEHVGHHFHAHKGEATKSVDGKPMADSDCASCHASGAVAIPTTLDRSDLAATPVLAKVVAPPLFTSALARAPDRPQWLRLV